MERLVQLGADIAKLWEQYGDDYLNGIQNTLILALVATLLGCIIGFVCGILNTIPCAKTDPPVKRFFIKLIRVIVRIYVEVFRGTPMMLQAVFIYYGLPYFTGNAVQWPSVWMAAILVVSINTGAYMAESVRGGIISIDPGQTEGAKAIGMTHVQTMTSVILPQALRLSIPGWANEFSILLKDSAVCYLLGTMEIMARVNAVAQRTHEHLAFFALAGVIYFVLTLIVLKLLRRLENKVQIPGYSAGTVGSMAKNTQHGVKNA